MHAIKVLVVASSLALSSWASAASPAAVPDAAQLAAVQGMLASMQAEKMLRMTAGMSRFADPQQRQAVMGKIEKVTPEEVYRRLAGPVARVVSTETATEMTHFYQSSYGKRVLTQTYNSGPSLNAGLPVPTAAEKADLKRPAYLKADKAFKAAEPAIRHETFVLMQDIARK